MEQRLLSRMKWGLSADLQAPELETRIAILEKKMYENGIELSKEVVEYLAYSINTNVREIEGALNSLIADRKSTRLNSSHVRISYAVFCLKKKKKKKTNK